MASSLGSILSVFLIISKGEGGGMLFCVGGHGFV